MDLLLHLFEGSPLVLRAIYLLQLGFTIWMAVDSYNRGEGQHWLWIIIIFQPFGAWIYFFAVKLRTLRVPGVAAPKWERKLSLDELRYRVERSPTVANRLAMAHRLMEKGRHADAIPYLEAILNVEAFYGPALHGLAECRLAAGEPDQAVAPLETLLNRDRRWSNYRAWHTLIEVHLARKEPADALKACRELEKHQPTLENKCRLAGHLIDNDLRHEAADLLDQALEDHHYSPWAARWRNWRWAREARRLLADAEKA